jgi:hypothetical protein
VGLSEISPRARRRLLWVAVLAVAGGGVALVFALLPESKGGFDNTPRSRETVQIVRPQRQVPLSRTDRAEINRLFDRFVPAAVERRHPEAAYDLVTKTLRSVAPRSQWRTGSIPVSPFDAAGTRFHGWTVITSYRTSVTLDLTLLPRNPKDGPASFTVDLKRIRGRWLVDEFFRRTSYGPAAAAKPRAKATTTAAPAHRSSGARGRLGAIWFLVPLGLLSLVVIVPAILFTRGWLQDKRVARRYRAELSSQLPPLPRPDRGDRTPGTS